MNQVDEVDLMKLMDEEELEQLKPVEETKPTPEPETKPETDTEVQEPEPEPEKKPNVLPAILTILLLAGGGGFYAFKNSRVRKKKKPRKSPIRMLIMWTMTRIMAMTRKMMATSFPTVRTKNWCN